MWEWISRVWNNGGRYINLDQAEFTEWTHEEDLASNVTVWGYERSL